MPIIQSTTFKYETSQQMGRLFDLEDEGYFYTRLQNPTNDLVAARMAEMEGGVAGVLTSSGQAANFFATFNICETGGHFISIASIYGGTFNLFAVTMKQMGIDVTFLDQDASDEEIEAAFRDNTKLVFGETVTNPGVKVMDLERWAEIAHRHGVPLIVDNTFPTAVNCRPFEWGADIVTYSTTKYTDGHGVAVGGAVIDSGNFDWMAHRDKFPGMCEPQPSYHGLVYAEKFGKCAYITKIVTHLMRDIGCIQSPQNAFYLNLGLQTLAVRMPHICKSAKKVAEWLKSRPEVAWVSYPDLEDDKYHALQQKYLPEGTCGVMAFGLKGDRARAEKFMDALKFVTIETHVADCYTCILHPASHTHRQLSDQQLMEAGVQPDLMRLSIGLEDVEDIIADLEQAVGC